MRSGEFFIIASIDIKNRKSFIAAGHLGDGAAGCLIFDRNGDRPAIILDDKNDAEAMQAGKIERFMEIPLRCRSIASRDIDNLILACELNTFGNAYRL